METPQYSTLLSALQDVPDPRKARGKRYRWDLVVLLSDMVDNSDLRLERE